jgi:hypothetical protein
MRRRQRGGDGAALGLGPRAMCGAIIPATARNYDQVGLRKRVWRLQGHAVGSCDFGATIHGHQVYAEVSALRRHISQNLMWRQGIHIVKTVEYDNLGAHVGISFASTSF